MLTIALDKNLCKKEGLCTSICPANIFVQDERLALPEILDEECCIACGQCVAICPQNAISHSEFPLETISKINFENIPTAEQFFEFLRTRRSIRAFKDKPIENDKIKKIIEGASFAPSGHNSQSTEFLVVQDKVMLNQVSESVIEYLKFEIKRFANPFFRAVALLGDKELTESGLNEIPGFKRLIHLFESGADPILFGAPVLIVFHAKRRIGFSDVNAQLALQNASLVAHSMGIGHFYTGWVVSPCRAPMARNWNRRIPNLLSIPSENKIHGALALGYPIPKFKNTIKRKSPQIKWFPQAVE
jgi:nitroreductase/NAD-dependent dihydropyrimidine dehydrogenase PreA subunit